MFNKEKIESQKAVRQKWEETKIAKVLTKT